QVICAAAKEGYKASVFLFDESRETYTDRAAHVNLDLASFLASGTVQVRQVDPNEQSPGEFVYHVRKQVEEGVRVVVIDSLNGFLTAMTSERFLLAQLHELLSFLNSHGVLTIMTTAQHGMLNVSETTSFELTYLADLVIYLRYFEAAGRVRKAISVIKNRLSAHEASIREFDVTSNGIEIGPPLKQFEGILTGIPRYVGTSGDLMDRGSAKMRNLTDSSDATEGP
nr:circadian clock protein KaiC [Acidobacteriota bacterium]